jgi:large subunit ribosomal protein L25
MSHETPVIAAMPRDRMGSRYAQRIRKSGRLPAIIYGHKTDPVAVSVDHKELVTALQHGAHLLNVSIDGRGSESCLVKDLQFGYLGDNLIHVDFARVDLDEEVEVTVLLRFVGEAPAAAKPGAILTQNLTQLPIICKANAIPDEIRVDLSAMEGESMSIDELSLPAGVKANADASTMIAQVSFIHEAESEGEEVEPGEAATPEVITEAKPKEE